MDFEKKKILHITHTDIRSDSRILKEVSGLGCSGKYEVKAIGIARNARDSQDLSKLGIDVSIKAIELFFVRKRWLPSTLRHALALVEFFFKTFQEARRFKPAVIHCHDTLAFCLGSIFSIFLRTKVIYDAHELESAKNGSTRLNAMLTLAVEKLFWPRVALFISVSPSILHWYTEQFGEKRACLVLNSPTLDAVEPNKERSYFHNHFKLNNDDIAFPDCRTTR